jgi:hypothetical protein
MRFRSASAGTRSASSSSWRRRRSPRGRHADHVRRAPVEPRAGHGVGRGAAWARLRARRERHAAGERPTQRAPRSTARRRGALRRVPRGARPGMESAAAELRAKGGGRSSFRWRVHAARRRGIRLAVDGAAAQIPAPDWIVLSTSSAAAGPASSRLPVARTADQGLGISAGRSGGRAYRRSPAILGGLERGDDCPRGSLTDAPIRDGRWLVGGG